MRLYVIGPVTGVEDDNLSAFAEARRRLAETGRFDSVGIPHDFIPSETPWADAMRISIRALLNHDGVAVLEGASGSRGASLEREIASSLGMPCRPVAEWLGALQDGSDAPSEIAPRPSAIEPERRTVTRATALECVKYVSADGYYALAVKGLDQERNTEFLIGKEGYAALEFCFGVTEQPGALSEGEYAEVCLSDYAELLDMRLDELDD